MSSPFWGLVNINRISQGLVSNFKDSSGLVNVGPKSKFHFFFVQAQTLTLKNIVATSARLYKRGVLKIRMNSLGEEAEASKILEKMLAVRTILGTAALRADVKMSPKKKLN